MKNHSALLKLSFVHRRACIMFEEAPVMTFSCKIKEFLHLQLMCGLQLHADGSVEGFHGGISTVSSSSSSSSIIQQLFINIPD